MIPFKETRRQWLHISMVGFALLLGYIPTLWAFFFAITAFIHNIFLLPKYAPELFRERERMMQGIAIYPLMVALIILFFPDHPILAAGAWGILAIGDGFSTLIGKKIPLVALPWNPQKSLGGMLGFIMFASIGAPLLMAWTGPFATIDHLIFVGFVAACAAAVYETITLPFDDNIVVALVAAAFCSLLWPLDLSLSESTLLFRYWFYAFLVNLFLAILAYQFHLVSKNGLVGGVVIGLIILVYGGIPLYCLLLLFFILASCATQFGYHEKMKLGIAQDRGGRRGATHAIANCLCALIAAFLMGYSDGADALLCLFYVAALATALSDTFSSELGPLYGTSPFLPTSFRLVPPGTVGAISVEGTLIGMGASTVFAFMAWAFTSIPFTAIPAVILGSWFGFYMESYISAHWIEKNIELNGQWMNLLNTFLGGSFALIIAGITHVFG